MTQRPLPFPAAISALLGAFAGLLLGTVAAAGIAYAMAAPITGVACITIVMAFFIMGGLAGAAFHEEMSYDRRNFPRQQPA
jgi:hypothetical protein